MTNEDNDKAQLMRNKARENAAFYYPKTIEGLEAKVRELEAQLAQAQASCAAMRDALVSSNQFTTSAGHKCESCQCMWDSHSPDCVVGKALSTTAGQELLDRLFKYEAQWNDMNFTICKLEQDLRKAGL